MWFKNATIYKIDPSQLPSIDDLRAALLRRPFSPCLGLDWFSYGWTSAAAHSEATLLLMAEELGALWADLIAALGGEQS